MLVQSELSTLFAKARRKGTETLLDVIIRAWDSPDYLQNKSLSNPIEARYPTLSIIGATQPERLRADMGNREVKSGFANRWLPMPGGSLGPNPEPPGVDKVRRDLLFGRIVRRLQDIRQANHGRPLEVPLSAECAEVWNTFYLAHWAQAYADIDIDEIITRYPTIVRKLALIYAITEDTRDLNPKIEVHHLRAAIALIDWAFEESKKIVGDWGASEESRIEHRITSALVKNGAPLSRRKLYQNTYIKGLPASQWDRVLKALMANQVVYEATSGKELMIGLPEHITEDA
jgi:hypothetical protein